MRHRFVMCCALVLSLPAATAAQDRPAETGPAPAGAILTFRRELELSETQIAKLQALAQAQATALSRATSAYLRAEADLIDASRGEDLVVRRAALTKRATVAIEAEIARLKSEKDSRAILTPKQAGVLLALPGPASGDAKPARVALWQAIVTATTLTAFAGEPDSAEVRLGVTPNHADIYIAGVKLGTGRKFVMLPVGRHEIQFHAAGCQDVVLPIAVIKGPPIVVPTQTLTCGKN